MSQFMLCESNNNLEDLACIKLKDYKANKNLFAKVVHEYLINKDLDKLWVLEDIDKYCVETQRFINEGIPFKNTKLYNLLYNLYNKCQCFILWYGDDYLELDSVTRQCDFFNLIAQEIKEPCCEIYIIMKRD